MIVSFLLAINSVISTASDSEACLFLSEKIVGFSAIRGTEKQVAALRHTLHVRLGMKPPVPSSHDVRNGKPPVPSSHNARKLVWMASGELAAI